MASVGARSKARSTFYDRRERAQSRSEGHIARQPPVPPRFTVPNAGLLDLTRRDLAASPFSGV